MKIDPAVFIYVLWECTNVSAFTEQEVPQLRSEDVCTRIHLPLSKPPRKRIFRIEPTKNETNYVMLCFVFVNKTFYTLTTVLCPRVSSSNTKKVRRGGCRREMFGQHGPSRQACLAKLAPGPAAVQCF